MRMNDHRGNSRDRAARKLFLLAAYGDGSHADCWGCGTKLDYDTVTADRILPGVLGGTYRRGNVRPACQPCQTDQGNYLRRILTVPGLFDLTAPA